MENNNSNNTIKIISWNVNQFCKIDNWEYKSLSFKCNNIPDVIISVKELLNIVGDKGCVFLQEVPFSVLEIIKPLLEVNNFSVIIPNYLDELGKSTKEITIAICNREYYYEKDYITTVEKIGNKNYHYYTNRSLSIVTEQNESKITITGTHGKVYKENTDKKTYDNKDVTIYWNDLLKNDSDIIIGDLNVDSNSSEQWKKYNEMIQNGYTGIDSYVNEEDEKAITFVKGGTCVDRVLYKSTKVSIVENKVAVLEKMYKGLSDHYPIMLEIKLNNDREEA